MSPIVEIRDLHVRFHGERTVYALNGVDITLEQGEVLGLLGESGSGKSVTLRALLRMLPPRRSRIEGSIRLDGEDVLALDEASLEQIRGGVASMIFQEPMLALDPVYTIGDQIAETVVRHRGANWAEGRKRALEMLEMVRIPSARRRLEAYPHEMSGGMRQRAMIALALSCHPKVLLADEPTTALDATVQMQILLLLRELQREFGMAVIFVTHDIGVAVESPTVSPSCTADALSRAERCAKWWHCQPTRIRKGCCPRPFTARAAASGWKRSRVRRRVSIDRRRAAPSRPAAESRTPRAATATSRQ